jgi:(2S)-methylsuccinyl-CoA dehydrogenase
MSPAASGGGAALLAECRGALGAAAALVEAARGRLADRVLRDGAPDAAALDREQFAAHGLAWFATYRTALDQLLAWAVGLDAAGRLGEAECLILRLGFAEYGAQLIGGVAMGQAEIVRPGDLGLDAAATAPLAAALAPLTAAAPAAALRQALAALLEPDAAIADGIEDDGVALLREPMRRAAERHRAAAERWHAEDRLIPLPIIEELATLGVFGVTVPAVHGGLGLGKLALVVVSEELSRGALALGSLGTRAEIAAELVRTGGTPAQQARWLPRIASGAVLPAAVFTEPEAGSDLGQLRTRAVRDGAVYRITGAKSWSTHAARADLLVLLARTGAPDSGHRGLSLFLADKPRGDDDAPFPVPGLAGSEVPVLGYRGLKEYDLAFDGFAVPQDGLLGGVEGEGFRQLMATFEAARIQTAARAVGVARNALELGLAYARQRRQFGRTIDGFPRIAGKLAAMAVETVIARQLTYHAARQKDLGRRCDIEAGMAKLLAARVAWSNADNALQIHGGAGYALASPISRVLCDARILSIFEGAAEIQAQVIARGLLAARN